MRAKIGTEDGRFVLTGRDSEILDLVYELRGCTTRQLQARFWGASTPAAASYRRIAKLIDAGLLSARRLPSKSGVGSGKRFLTLGPNGRRLVSARRRLRLSEVVSADPSSWFFADHHEAVADFRIALDESLKRAPHVQLREWVSESELRAAPIRITDTFEVKGSDRSRLITLVPDAAFTLAVAGRTQRYAVEVDMGTISLNRLEVRLRGYLRLQFDELCPVLFVVWTRQRAQQIAQVVEAEADELGAYGEFIYVSTLEDVGSGSVLRDPIWIRAGQTGRVQLVQPPVEQLREAS